jgi:spore germination protein GerM
MLGTNLKGGLRAMKKFMCILLAMLLMVGALSACSFKSLKKKSEETAKNATVEDVQPASSTMITEDQLKKEGEKVILTLYFADKQATKLVAEKRFVAKSSVKDINETAKVVMAELFKGPISGNLTSPFPKGVKIPSVKVEKNTAMVDLSKEFVEKHPGGSTGETLTIYSIVNTLTAISGIDQVQFTVDGKKVPEFKGHLDISKPFKAKPDLIAQENKEVKDDKADKADAKDKTDKEGKQGQ